MDKYIIVIRIDGSEFPVDCALSEPVAIEMAERAEAAYDDQHNIAVVKVPRSEPSHYNGRTVRYQRGRGALNYWDNQYA